MSVECSAYRGFSLEQRELLQRRVCLYEERILGALVSDRDWCILSALLAHVG